MFNSIFGFEMRYQLKQPLFYICFAMIFLLTFLAITTDAVTIGGSIGNVNRNAPYVIMQIALVMSAIGIFITTAFVASSVHRDYETGAWPLFFSKPITKRSYLGGRFSAALSVSLLVFVSVMLAIMIGSKMPWLEAERIGPFMLSPYAFSMFVLILPNIFLAGAIFFCVAALTRSMLATYAGVGAFFVAYAIASAKLSDLDNQYLAGLLDPFGFAAFTLATKYWTVYTKNAGALSLDGVLLYNRLIWISVGMATLLFTNYRFRFAAGAVGGKKMRREVDAAIAPAVALPQVTQTFDGLATFRQFLNKTRVEFLGIVKGIPFIVLAFLGVLNIIGNSSSLDSIFDTNVWPVTSLMIRIIGGSYLLYTYIIVTFYGGELVWRERQLKLSDVYDALPTKTWTLWASKFAAITLSVLLLLSVAVLTGMGVQLYHGYSNFELGLYAQGLLLLAALQFLFIVVLTFAIQALANNKFLGVFLVISYYVLIIALPAMHFEHHLYLYGTGPQITHSDMNGWGHFVKPTLWFSLYWSLFATLLMVVAHLFWPRGTESAWKRRVQIARGRFKGSVVAVAALALLAFVGCGAFIFYNTNVLNKYVTSNEVEKTQAEFEKLYKKYENFPQPRITDIRTNVDIDPLKRAAHITGSYAMENRTAAPVRELHYWINPNVKLTQMSVGAGKYKVEDKKRGYYIFTLDRPLAPGEKSVVTYTVDVVNPGFRNGGEDNHLVANGSFFNSYDYYPHFGYNGFAELQDRAKRRKYGLGAVQRMAKLTDMKARQNNYLSKEADWVNFEATVSTTPDQIAIAPGYLQREWTENGRRYFHYKMDAPILDFFAFISANYAVKKDKWNNVAIEVYYDAKHPYNVDRMIESTKASLDYFTKNFGPYQHRQVRIIEFPRTAGRFAQAFPNTIPFSESIGFIANLENAEDIDYVYYVTAHEVAHQWWAHQVIGAETQGSTMLSETMAQYSALMVMEKRYGREQMKKFLKYELDNYLRSRGGELVAETPLVYVENQPYIHYRKGSVIMYALRDLIGEETLNGAIHRFRDRVAFQQPPYTVSMELLDEIKKATPAQYQATLTDMFERITLFENRATEVTSKKRADGKYVVRMKITAKKFYSDEGGQEKEAAVRDWIDIGVVAPKDPKTKEEKVLYLERRLISQPETTVEVVVDQQPGKAGIDPLHKLIDRNPDDNLKSVL